MYGCCNDCLILIPFRPPQISRFTLSLQCFSSDSDIALMWGSDPWFSFPYLPRAGPFLLTLLFFPLVPLSYRVLLWFYIFFSTGQVLLSAFNWCSALLCLKVYSWWICGERCTAHPPTPLPSCSPSDFFFLVRWFICCKFIQLAEWNLNPPICTGHWKML